MKVLVINAGSSSLKYQLIDMDDTKVLAKGLCERIGIEGSKLTHTNVAKDQKIEIVNPMKDHSDAIGMVLRCNQKHGGNRSGRSQSCAWCRVLC